MSERPASLQKPNAVKWKKGTTTKLWSCRTMSGFRQKTCRKSCQISRSEALAPRLARQQHQTKLTKKTATTTQAHAHKATTKPTSTDQPKGSSRPQEPAQQQPKGRHGAREHNTTTHHAKGKVYRDATRQETLKPQAFGTLTKPKLMHC